MNFSLIIALLLSFATVVIHVSVGGADTAQPILDSDLSETTRMTAFYAWHMATVILVAMTLLLGDALFMRQKPDSAGLVAFLAFTFAALAIGQTLSHDLDWMVLPQWMLFIPLGVFSALGAAKMGRDGKA
ncbi:MAG: hypothetical protein AAGC95_13645 [Pseudomonadota bacterium]